MGRLFGRRPDRTAAIARSLGDDLLPGERVLAAVDVQTPGTLSAGLRGGASGATAAASGGLGVTFGTDDPKRITWITEATSNGIDLDVARSLVWLAVALTSDRLIVVRRSRLSRRPAGIVVAWPLDEIQRIEVPRRSQRLTIVRGEHPLTFEIAVAPKFRPEVYDQLPHLLETARAQVVPRPDGP